MSTKLNFSCLPSVYCCIQSLKMQELSPGAGWKIAKVETIHLVGINTIEDQFGVE